MLCCPPIADRQEPSSPAARRRSPRQLLAGTLREPGFGLLFAASLLHFAFGDPTEAGLLLGLGAVSVAIVVMLRVRDDTRRNKSDTGINGTIDDLPVS